MLSPYLASVAKLISGDLVVIALILAVLAGISAAIAIPIIFIIKRRTSKPPPLPQSPTNASEKAAPPI